MIITRPALSGIIRPFDMVPLEFVRPPRLYSAKPPLGAGINWGHPLATGLVNSFLFNEAGSNTIHDIANPLLSGIFQGAVPPTWSTDNKEISVTTIGSSGPNIPVPVADTDYLGDLSILWGGWFRVASIFHNLIFKAASNGATNNPLEFRTNNTNPLSLQFVDADASHLNTWSCATTFSTGTHHLLGVSRPANLSTAPTFYIDGVSGAAPTGGGTAVTATGTNANLLFLRRADGGTGLDGQITVCMIWKRLLSATEFASLYVNPYQFIVPVRFY